MSIYDEERKIKASPATRKLAKELGVDLTKVRGTALDGRIQVEDIKRYVNNGSEDENDMGMSEYKGNEIEDVTILDNENEGIDPMIDGDSFADSIIDKTIEESLEKVMMTTIEDDIQHIEEVSNETISEIVSDEVENEPEEVEKEEVNAEEVEVQEIEAKEVEIKEEDIKEDVVEDIEEVAEDIVEEVSQESEEEKEAKRIARAKRDAKVAEIVGIDEDEIKKELEEAVEEDILNVLGLQVEEEIIGEEEEEEEEVEEMGGYILGMPIRDPDEIATETIAYEEAIKESYSIRPIESTKPKTEVNVTLDDEDEDVDEMEEVFAGVTEDKDEPLNDIPVGEVSIDLDEKSISEDEIERILNDPDYKPEEKAEVVKVEEAPIVDAESNTKIIDVDNDIIMFENANNAINLDEDDEEPEIEIEINHITNEGIVSTSKDINYENADEEIKNFIELNSQAIFGNEINIDDQNIIVNNNDEVATVEDEIEEEVKAEDEDTADDLTGPVQTSITGEDDVSLKELDVKNENNDVLEFHSTSNMDDGYYQEGVVITLNDEVINTIIVDEDILGKIDDDNKLVLSAHTHNSLAMGIRVSSNAIKNMIKPLEPTDTNLFFATAKAIAYSLKKHKIQSFDDSFFIYKYDDTFTRSIIENVSSSSVDEIKENMFAADDELESVYKIIDVNSFDIDYFFPKQCKEKVEIIVFVVEDEIKVIINSDKNIIDFPDMANVLMTLKKCMLNPSRMKD